ncbi:MAG: cytochrome c oxidase subunit II [Gemmatimonadota bacterium]
MDWLLDPSVSTFGPDIDRIYYIILVITGAVFFGTELLLVYFLFRYRHREGQRAEYIHGSTKAEVIWTAVPFVIVVVLAFMSAPVWNRIKNPEVFPADSYEVMLTARQFEWETRYAGADGQFETADDFTLLNRMNVPVDRPILIHLASEDVIHSFFVYDFRLKQDAVPGMVIPIWFEAIQTGEYTLGCAELCGTGHSTMDGIVAVQPQAEFEAWEATQVAARQAVLGGVLASLDIGAEAGNGAVTSGLAEGAATPMHEHGDF